MIHDPDELSTATHRILSGQCRSDLTGTYVNGTTEQDMLELQSDGLIDNYEKTDHGFKARLNGHGLEILKAI